MNRRGQLSRELTGAATVILLCSVLVGPAWAATAATGEAQMSFGTPEAAVEVLRSALKDDENRLITLFGQEYANQLLSKDKAVAREGRENLYKRMEEGVTLRKDTADLVVLVIGNNQWPFPIPLVRSGSSWRFHTAAGLEEILDRRIGRNELNTIWVCREYLAAQEEYASKIRDDRGVRKFAQRLVSTQGKQDGLYWDPAAASGEESPFGPLVAEYLKGGRKPGEPYYGYYFRILTRQGSNAPGGRYDYIVNGNMIGGFALVAFPAAYGESGVMTFLISHHGTVYQKNFGPRTAVIARDMSEFNPDKTWTEVQE